MQNINKFLKINFILLTYIIKINNFLKNFKFFKDYFYKFKFNHYLILNTFYQWINYNNFLKVYFYDKNLKLFNLDYFKILN